MSNTKYSRSEDPINIIPGLDKSVKDEIINIIVPKGTEQYMSFTAADNRNSLRLCTTSMRHCFKARVIMIASMVPGYRFSAYQYTVHTKPGILTSLE